MNSLKREEAELRRAGYLREDSDYGGGIGKAVLELCSVFASQGHSGASAMTTAGVFHRLITTDVLCPIKEGEGFGGEPLGPGLDGMRQNYICPALFIDKDGKCRYNHSIVWRGEKPHDTFTGTVDGISSRQEVVFPFMPKTFHVDVVQVPGTECDYRIKDRAQLEEVWGYYRRP